MQKARRVVCPGRDSEPPAPRQMFPYRTEQGMLLGVGQRLRLVGDARGSPVPGQRFIELVQEFPQQEAAVFPRVTATGYFGQGIWACHDVLPALSCATRRGYPGAAWR